MRSFRYNAAPATPAASSNTLLAEPLKQLGMKLAFDSSEADLRGISACGHLFVDGVYHEVFVRVDEEGTEAAAATAAGVAAISGVDVQWFVVNRPFLFAIRHRPSGALLFLGRVVAPVVGGDLVRPHAASR